MPEMTGISFNESLFRGDCQLNLEGLPQSVPKTVKVYLCATATDTVQERNALVVNVYPRLRQYCREKYGIEFQVIDLRWGIGEEWSDLNTDRELAAAEIKNCQEQSIGPSFVALIGQKYGESPLPRFIPSTEFDLILTTLKLHRNRETRDAGLLEVWYKEDQNANPPVYLLQDVQGALDEHMIHQAKTNLTKEDRERPFCWLEVKAALKRLLKKGLEYCVVEGTITDMEANNYAMSDLECEIHQGALQTTEPHDSCLVFVRDIVDLKNYCSLPSAKNFADIIYDDLSEKFTTHPDANERMTKLRNTSIARGLPKSNVQHVDVLWKHDDGIHHELHKDYLVQFCQTFEEQMKILIDKAGYASDGQKNSLESEIMSHWQMVKQKCETFVGRDDLLHVIQSYVVSNDQKPLVLHGESGSGKSALLAVAAAAVRHWEGEVINIVRFIGTTPSSFDIRQILYSICRQIVTVLKEDASSVPTAYSELLLFFEELLYRIPNNTTLVIFIDSLHMLVPQYNAHTLNWIPRELKENVKIVVSTLPKVNGILDKLLLEVVADQNNFVDVLPMSVTECTFLLDNLLAKSERKLSDRQRSMVQGIFHQCSYPLYVHLFEKYARLWNSSMVIDKNLFPTTIKGCVERMLDILENKHGHQLVSKCLAYLTASTSGISECEMEDLLSLDDDVLNEVYQVTKSKPLIRRIPPIFWHRLKHELKDFLLLKDCEGLSVLYWNHRFFIDVCKTRYLSDEKKRKQIHSLLADYHLGLWHGVKKSYKRPSSANNNDEYGEEDRLVPPQPLTFKISPNQVRYNTRKYEQVPRHLFLSGRLKELNDLVLFSYEWLYNKTKSMSLEQILADFVLNPGVEATLVERAIRDAQSLITDDINCMGSEITGRLLAYYDTHSNIRKLISECDRVGLKHNALVPNFPYHQVPGSPLKYTINCKSPATCFGLAGPNGRYMLAKNSGKSDVHVFDLAQGEFRKDIITSAGEMHLTPSGKYMAVIDPVARRAIKIHITETGQYLGQLIPMNQIRMKPKQKYKLDFIAVSDFYVCMIVTIEHSFLCIADIETCRFKTVIGLEGRCNFCAITPDSRYVMVNANEKLLSYNLLTLEQRSCTTLEYSPKKLCFNSLVTKGFLLNEVENKVYVLAIGNGCVEFVYKVVIAEAFEGDQVSHVVISNNEDMVLLRGQENILIYHIVSEKIMAHITKPSDVPREFKLPKSGYVDIHFTQACFSPDDKFVMGTIFRNVYIWNISNNRLLTTLQAPVGVIKELYVPPDRGQLITHLDGSNVVHVWSLGDAIGSIGMLDKFTSAVGQIKVTRDDSTAFVRCKDSDEIGVVNISTGEMVDLMTHESPVLDFTITHDGHYILVSLKDGKPNTLNKIWYTDERKVIYEFGNMPATCVSLQNENTIVCIMQDSPLLYSTYHICQFKFKDGTFDEYRFDNEINFMLTPPFITPEDKYLVLLSADSYDDKNALYVNPTICAISLQSNVTMSTFSAKELAAHVQMKRILHIRPCQNNSYTVVVLFTNEPDYDDSGRSSRGYDHCYHFMIFDICSGVVCQIIENFMAPSTPIEKVLFTKDVKYCIDHQSNVFDMATGYFVKCLHEDEPQPRSLALNGKVALYFKGSYIFAIRISDSKCIGRIHAHGEVSTLHVCNNESTIIAGCTDGSLISYVLLDSDLKNVNSIIESIPSRKHNRSQSRIGSAASRTWDKVDFENERNAPPYSRPPSASVIGPSDKEVLSKIRPVSRTRPVSDTYLYSGNPSSKTCSVM